MKRLLRAACTLSLLLALCGGPCQAEGIDSDLAAVGAKTAAALDALADWCTKKRVFGSRDDAYVELLAFDPMHRNARKRLRYKRGEDAGWVQDPKYKRAKNWNRKAAKEAAGRLAQILAEHRAAVVARCAGAESIGDLLAARRVLSGILSREPANTEVPPVLRTLTMRYYGSVRAKGLVKEMAAAAKALCDSHPEDAEVRALLGEVLHEDRWVLAETARALRDSNGITAAANAALEAVRPKASKPTTTEGKIELPWVTAVQTSEIRVAGTQEEKVLTDIARKAHASGALFEHAFGRKPTRRAGLTVYAFKEKGEVDTFLAGFPVVDNHTLRERKKIKLDLVYADGRTLVLEANPPRAQIDLVVNEVFNQVFADTFLASEAPKGWHAEGLSRYLAWKLTGTRLSIAVSGKYAGQGGDRHVPESGDPWLLMARTYVQKGADLRLLLGKGVDVFSVSDSMVAYAFAVYLLEGHAGVTSDFVTALTKTADADKACVDVLGMPRPVVEQRLKRWLDEMTTKQRAAAAKAAAAKRAAAKKAADKKKAKAKKTPKKGKP